jgi:large subunit ribosomal protein L19
MISEQLRSQIATGAKVRVFEGKAKSPFTGLVIATKHGKEAGGTFTVRSVVGGVGVEKVLPFNSPNITKVEIVNAPKNVHKSKLYYVREMSGSTIRKRLGASLS